MKLSVKISDGESSEVSETIRLKIKNEEKVLTDTAGRKWVKNSSILETRIETEQYRSLFWPDGQVGLTCRAYTGR